MMRPAQMSWASVAFRAVVLACLLAGMAAGCLIIPTPEHGLIEGRGIIEEADTRSLVEGTTLREDVLLRFGEPDLIVDQGRILVYHWRRAQGYVIVGGAGGGAAAAIPKDHFLVIEFDDAGLVQQFELSNRLQKPLGHPVAWGRARAGPEAETRQHMIIDPMPPAPAEPDALARISAPVRIRVDDFQLDGAGSTSLMGHKSTSAGIIMADVLVRGSRPEIVRAVVARQLQQGGHELVMDDAEVLVTGQLADFGVAAPLKFPSWDAVASLDVTLRFQCMSSSRELLVRRYQSVQKAKPYSGSGRKDFEQVSRACLEDLQRQLAADTELADWLGDVSLNRVPAH